MLKNLLTPKVLCVEVIRGLDIEQIIPLVGDRVTIGTAASDTLRLTDDTVEDCHIVFQKAEGKSGWEYYSGDHARTAVDRGNPRVGRVRAGMEFSIGEFTGLRVVKTIAKGREFTCDDAASPKEVPLAVAVPLMALFGAAAVFAMAFASGPSGGGSPSLYSSYWYHAPDEFKPFMDACLADADPAQHARIVPANAPSASFQRWISSDESAASTYRDRLADELRNHTVAAHLLWREDAHDAAKESLTRLLRAMPLDPEICPLVEAVLEDIATIEFTKAMTTPEGL